METSIISQKIEWFGGRPLLVGGLPSFNLALGWSQIVLVIQAACLLF